MKNMLKEKYLLEVSRLEKNEESTVGNVYMIFSNRKIFVAKVYDDIKHVQRMVKLHSELSLIGLSVPAVISNKEGSSYTKLSNNKYFVMYSFMNGIEVANSFDNLPKNISSKIAKELRKLHNKTGESNKYDLAPIPFDVDVNFDRNAVLHFDITRNNVFYDEDAKTEIGFIDFDDAKYGPAIYDVAIAAANLFFSKTRGVDLEGLKIFIESYYEKDEEIKKHEIPYIKKIALLWIDYILDNNTFDSSTTKSLRVKRKLIEKNGYLKF